MINATKILAKSTFAIVFFSLLNATVCPRTASGQNAANVPYLRGSDASLAIRIRGHVVDQNGHAVKDAIVQAVYTGRHENVPLKVEVDDDQFFCWVPVGGKHTSVLIHLAAFNAKKSEAANLFLQASELHDAAVNGRTMNMSPLNKKLTVKTQQDGQMVANANVIVRLQNTSSVVGKTDDSGTFTSSLVNDASIQWITAWTDDHKIGGRVLFGKADANSDIQTIPLFDCHDHIVRLVTQDGTTCSDVPLSVGVSGTGENSFAGRTELGLLRSDDKGEVVFRWFPDWQDARCRVDVMGEAWTSVAQETNENITTVTVKPRAPRTHVRGQLLMPVADVAGLCIKMMSFQGERERRLDILLAFTNAKGQFFANVLPGSRYVVFLDEKTWVSDHIDLIPSESDTDRVNTPIIKAYKGTPVKIRVTEGKQRTPVANKWVSIRTKYEFESTVDDKTRTLTLGRDAYAMTDSDGTAVIYQAAGPARAIVSDPGWKAYELFDIETGRSESIQLHREDVP